jgi:hypothetical protein
VTVTLSADGPRAIDVEDAMARASARGLLSRFETPSPNSNR